MLRTSVLIPIPGRPEHYSHKDDSPDTEPGGIQVPESERRRVIQTLNYLEYRIRSDIQKESSLRKEDEQGHTISAVEVAPTALSQATRMFTIFPYKDMNYIVTMLFVVGSIAFVINAGFGLFPLLDPRLAFDTLATLAIPATIMLGACMFLTGGFLGVFAAFNADRGTLENTTTAATSAKSIDDDDEGNERGNGHAIYRPALIGSEAWVWIPSAADVVPVLRTVPFQAGLVMLSGGMILSTSAVASIPGVLDAQNIFLLQVLVFLPQVIGGTLFFLANAALVIESQERWYSPRFWSSEWQGAVWNTIASAGFAITGVLLLENLLLEAAVVSFVASSAFLIGSIFQWYALMEYHATPWAA